MLHKGFSVKKSQSADPIFSSRAQTEMSKTRFFYLADALVDRVARFAGVFSFAGVFAFFAGASAAGALRFAGVLAGALVSFAGALAALVAFAGASFSSVFSFFVAARFAVFFALFASPPFAAAA